MQLDINIEQIVADAVASALTPEKLQPLIARNVESAVKSAIDGAFSYHSPFSKLLHERVREAMPRDIENLGRYGDLVLKTINAFLNENQNQVIQESLAPKLESMLRKLPSRMKLSELVAMLVEDFADDYKRDGAERPTFKVKRYSSVGDHWHLLADPRESAYSCRIQAAFDGDGRCYSLKVDGEDLQKKLLIGPTYNADALMLNLYTGGIVVELDQEDFSDVYYPDSSDN